MEVDNTFSIGNDFGRPFGKVSLCFCYFALFYRILLYGNFGCNATVQNFALIFLGHLFGYWFWSPHDQNAKNENNLMMDDKFYYIIFQYK